MRTFVLYVHDDRDTVPNLLFVTVVDAERAREIAWGQLNRSDHHLAIDVREGDEWLFRVKRSDGMIGDEIDRAVSLESYSSSVSETDLRTAS